MPLVHNAYQAWGAPLVGISGNQKAPDYWQPLFAPGCIAVHWHLLHEVFD